MSRRIGIASAIWGASILLSRLVGLVREAVIGRTLGGSGTADVYFTAFTLPDFLNYLLAGGALSIVFIPIFAGHLARGDERRAWAAFSAIASFLCVVFALLLALAWVFLPRITPLIAPGYTPEQHALLVSLSRIVLFAQLFHVLGGLLSAALQARDRHVLAALAPLIYTVCTIAGGLIGGSSAGAFGFAWGILVGSVFGPFALPLWGCVRSGLQFRFRFAPRDADLKLYLRRSLPIMIGFSIVVVDDWILRREASLLATGAVSMLNYAKTLMRVPMGVFGLAAGVAAFPTLSRYVAEGKPGEMYRALLDTTRRMLIFAFAAQAVLSVCGFDIIALIYGRRLLSHAQLADIAVALTAISVGLCAWAAQPLLARGFYALGNTWLPAATGTLIAIVCYPVYVLGRDALGTRGLALASSLAIVIYAIVLAMLLRRAVRRLAAADYPAWTPFLLRAASALLGAVGVGRWIDSQLPPATPGPWQVARAMLLGAATLSLFFGFARLVRLDEVAAIAGALQRRFVRTRAPLG